MMFVQKRSLTLSPLELHHPRPALPLWSLFGAAGAAGGLVYPGTHQPKPAVQQLEEALWRPQPPS